ncbi:glycosyltransferase family 2 protein [Zooshikella harenae]|uniref:Glycosyltransferase n=1 Tax=Zooshikella harenae TaxID=2827238 RepID=A0ABS5Z905_9GAMM|nr:glycosyltransferase family 2 protein [Zooshikella harenae]MBU2710383.1 glycosyltransferase [Zooshikella harenae]
MCLKISIITVCFNSSATIRRTIESVLKQNYCDIEYIIVDGASTDNTMEIIFEYRERISKVISEPDKGIYDAMNKGLDFASGDIICFLNADDLYAKLNVLSLVSSYFQKGGLDVLMGDVVFFHHKNPTQVVRRYRSDRFTPEKLSWGWMPAHPALFLSKRIIQRVGRFKTDYHIAGDFEFIVRIFHGYALQYLHIPEVLVNMQTGGVSTKGLRSKIQLNQEVLRACRDNGLSTNILKILSKYPLKFLEIIY